MKYFSALIILLLISNKINSAFNFRDQHSSNHKTLLKLIEVYSKTKSNGILDYFANNKSKITKNTIEYIAEQAYKEKNRDVIIIAELLAEQFNDGNLKGDVYFIAGKVEYMLGKDLKALLEDDSKVDYWIHFNHYGKDFNSFSEAAAKYFNKAIESYSSANNARGVGDVLFKYGKILYKNGDLSAAMKFLEAINYYRLANNIIGQAEVYKELGDDMKDASFQGAVENYQKALELYKKTGSELEQAKVYQCLGEVYYRLLLNQDALDMYSKAIQIYKKLNYLIGLGEVYKDKGELYKFIGEYKLSMEMFKRASYFFNNMKLHSAIQGALLIKQGDILVRLGYYTGALERYKKSIILYEKEKNLDGQGNAYTNIGLLLIKQGENQKAFEQMMKALALFDSTKTINGKFEMSSALYNTAEELSQKGLYQKALMLYNVASGIYDQAMTLEGDDRIYLGLANTYLLLGDIQNSIKNLSRVTVGSKILQEFIMQADAYKMEGDIYSIIGDTINAAQFYTQAKTIYEKANYPFGQGNMCLIEGDKLLKSSNGLDALGMFKKALLYFQKVMDLVGQGNAYLGIADFYWKRNDQESSLFNYSKALSYFERANSPLGRAKAFEKLGDYYFKKNNFQQALENYEKSKSFYEMISYSVGESQILLKYANVYNKLGQPSSSFDFYDKGLQKLEDIRINIGFSEMKLNFQQTITNSYNKAINFALKSKNFDKAFKYVEGIKSRTTMDQLIEKTETEKGLNIKLKERRDSLVSRLSSFQMKLASAREPKEIKELKSNYNNTNASLEEVKQSIRFYNTPYSLIHYPEPIAVEDFQNKVLKEGEVLLQYYFGDDSVYVFVLTKNLFKVVRLPDSRKEIENAADDFYTSFLVNEKYPFFSDEFYYMIIEPVKEFINGQTTLIIVPDGILTKIPFEALYKKEGEKGKFLLEDYDIKYVQSGTMLSLLRNELKSKNGDQNLVAFGDPVYDYEDYMAHKPEKGERGVEKKEEFVSLSRGGYERGGGKLNRLEGSGEEVKEILELFGNESKKYLRLEATEENAKSDQVKKYGYILLSCHGLLADDYQCLVLSQIPGSKEDGYLTMGEIMNLDWNANLVVMSACNTGNGQIKRGEGVVGLTRAMMYAGTPAVVSSLWSVSDEGTKTLMINLFTNIIKNKMSKSEALRQAKISMIKTRSDFQNPFYWSAFVLYGE